MIYKNWHNVTGSNRAVSHDADEIQVMSYVRREKDKPVRYKPVGQIVTTLVAENGKRFQIRMSVEEATKYIERMADHLKLVQTQLASTEWK